ncbi:biotin/lipoyl-containing protein [Halomonas heilongjiangensis]|uniref:Biotin attachment protein n=1 Tax=Halomonas heilongjiangensis TaxID=1387883 RepID=A0A2N7TJV7_9GAMM|nr:lipoyl domain-containing protein [Halomonas heilongjiangensis]PMR68467.1 biotin attachment protein [Halomonas heilongjiangensis]PXX86626.1 biotin attachment protein [Halomonas heilongjiangensis]
MTTEITVPEDLWEGDSEAVITAWLVDDGAEVAQGDLVAEVMVEKAQYEIEAPVSGKLSIAKAEDEVVTKGTTIARLEA